MTTHSSVLAWRIPGTGKPSGLLSMGSHRVDTTEATEQQQQLQLICESSLAEILSGKKSLSSSCWVLQWL